MIKIIAIGRKHEVWIHDAIERFQTRLRSPWDVEWVFARQALSARQDESTRVLTRLTPEDFVVLLDETGTLYNSPTLSQLISDQINHSRPLVIIIGGAYGVDDHLKARADIVWSLSPLVFPHQLVRLIIIEQLYRAQEIAHNRPYHHA